MQITIIVDEGPGADPGEDRDRRAHTDVPDAVDTGPPSSGPETAYPTAGAVRVDSPASDGPPPNLPELSAAPEAVDALPDDRDAGRAPDVSELIGHAAVGPRAAGGARP